MNLMLGPQTIVLLWALFSGTLPNDLISWIKPEDYFQERKIEVSAGKMLELADKAPSDAKSSLQQLLALRWLGEHAADTKKLKEARSALEQIAAGKKGDAQGFAKAEAQRTLALLDGKVVLPRVLPENSIKADGLKWFPGAAQFFGGMDLRATDLQTTPDLRLRDALQRALFAQAPAREFIYDFAETVGNLRIDRLSVAYAHDSNNPRQGKLFVRVTGLGDRERVVKFISSQEPKATLLVEKGPKGEPISILDLGGREPTLAVIGDEDLIIAGHPNSRDAKNIDVLRELLKVRADGKGSVITGPLADLLQRVPGNASAAAVAHIPEDVLKDMTSEQSPFKTFPQKVVISKTMGKTQDIRWFGTLEKAEDAKEFVKAATALKQKGIDLLKMVPPEAKIKKETLTQLSKTLEAVKIEADGKAIGGGVQIPAEVSKALVDAIEAYFTLIEK